jgi:hypothetical protein
MDRDFFSPELAGAEFQSEIVIAFGLWLEDRYDPCPLAD